MAAENRNGAVALDFADGAHHFRLGMGELEELQEKTGVGPFRLTERLMSGDWYVADVRETIRLGLIGGGLDPLKALGIVRNYVDGRPQWVRNALLAHVILSQALAGAPEEEPGKDDAPEAASEAPSSPMDASPSALSTALPPSAESPSATFAG